MAANPAGGNKEAEAQLMGKFVPGLGVHEGLQPSAGSNKWGQFVPTQALTGFAGCSDTDTE